MRRNIPNIGEVTVGEWVLIIYMIISLFPIIISFPILGIFKETTELQLNELMIKTDTFLQYIAVAIFIICLIYLSRLYIQ